MRRGKYIGLFLGPSLILGALAACDDEDTNVTPGGDAGKDGTSEASLSDSPSGDVTQPPTDGGDGGPGFASTLGTMSVLANFNPAMRHAPEGVTALPKAGDFGQPLAAFTPRGIIANVNTDGGYDLYSTFNPWSPSHRSLGIETNAAGDTFVGVGFAGAADAGANPEPGVYKIAAGGGAATKVSNTGVGWPAGLTFIGTDLWIADSNGNIQKMAADGTTTIASSDAILKGNQSACAANPTPLATPRPFGAAWATHDAAGNLYVTNFDFGAIIKFPVTNGTLGAPVIVLQGLLNGGTDCQYQGLKGIAVDEKDGSLFVASPISNSLWHVSADGKTVKKELTGKPPFDQVSGIYVDKNAATNARRLLVSNFAILAINADAGPLPQMLSIPLTP